MTLPRISKASLSSNLAIARCFLRVYHPENELSGGFGEAELLLCCHFGSLGS